MSTCRIRRVGHYEGRFPCISSCAQKERVLCSECDHQNVLHLNSICLWVPVNLRKSCRSSGDENSINEYTSNRKGRIYGGLCFCISSCAQKKGVLCSKCDDQSFLKFAQHLPLGSVNVW